MQYSKEVNQIGRNLTSLEQNIFNGESKEIQRKLLKLIKHQNPAQLEFTAQLIVDGYRQFMLLLMKEDREKAGLNEPKQI
jgi:hypothetical protein